MAFTMFPEFSFQITETTNERNLRLLMGLGFGVLMREARFATWIYEHFSYWVLVRVGWYWCTEPPPLTGPTISSALICAKWEVGGRSACLSVIADWSPQPSHLDTGSTAQLKQSAMEAPTHCHVQSETTHATSTRAPPNAGVKGSLHSKCKMVIGVDP